MASDASWPLQQAIYSALDAALSVPVYDDVPQDATFPYVTIGEDTVADRGTKAEAGQEFTVTVHAWSRQRGRKEAKEILGQIYAALHEQALTVTGFGVSLVRFEFADSFLDQDGVTRHAVSRYRIFTTT